MTRCKKQVLKKAVFLVMFGIAAAANPHGWSPSVTLRDGSDEPDGNGWCPDIRGFGASLNCNGVLQCHSCKPAGSDTQFGYDNDASRTFLFARNFDAACTDISDGEQQRVGGCITVIDAVAPGAALTLGACDDDFPTQNFVYTTSGYLRISSSGSEPLDLCLGVGEDVYPAGRFWARELLLLDCAATSPSLISWDIDPIPATVLDDSSPMVSTVATAVPLGSSTGNPTENEAGTNSPSVAPVVVPTSSQDSTTSSSFAAQVSVYFGILIPLLWL